MHILVPLGEVNRIAWGNIQLLGYGKGKNPKP